VYERDTHVLDEDGSTKLIVYVQDLLKKTVQVNKNTLLAELTVSIRLFEDDYVDYSSFS